MKNLKSYHNERGAALVISLMFIAILGMLGTTAVVLTTTDIQIGSNYRQHNDAFYTANAGVQFVIGTIENDLKDETTIANGTANVLPTVIGNSEPFTANPSGFFITISDITMISKFPHVYSFTSSSNNTNNGAKVEILARFKKDPFDPAFDVGIVADESISISGGPEIVGSLHANGSAVQTGNGTIDGNVSTVGTMNIGAAVTGTETENADSIDVPLIQQEDFDRWLIESQDPPNIYSASDYEYSDDGDQEHKIVFVDGDITVEGSDLQNVTIIATGNITINGSSTVNVGDSIGTSMIAGGDIIFNGSSHTCGAFWCNGNFEHNGSGSLEGAIVAGGNVERNGGFDFVHNSNFEDEHLPPSDQCEIISWENVRG